MGMGELGRAGILQAGAVGLEGVIGLGEILHQQLPVGFPDFVVAGKAPHVRHVLVGDQWLEPGHSPGERIRVRVEIDQHEAMPDLASELRQAALFRPEPFRLVHEAGGDELALKLEALLKHIAALDDVRPMEE